jgi:sialate O-acetylesterase
MYLKISCLLPIALAFTLTAEADVTLPSVLGSNMVLQQKDSVKLWGWASPNQQVYITSSWDNKTDSALTGNDAKWELKKMTPAAGGPFTITFRENNTVVLDNVMIGEVWICSGQSNMEWGVRTGLKEMDSELLKAPNKNLRLFQIEKTTAAFPQDNVPASWQICDSNSLKLFSAVGYFFALRLMDSLHVPVGLINASWGGTPAEVWTPAPVIENDDVLKADAAKLTPALWWPNLPGLAYNAMIAPVTNFRIAGGLFYQGEANTQFPTNYSKLFSSMITSWREKWSSEFPFYFVQIAPYAYHPDQKAYVLREQQAKTLALKNTGMVVVSDLVNDTTNIHPINKHDVGYRLAKLALVKTYNHKFAGFESPEFKQMSVEGNKVKITFDDPGSGLVMKGKDATELMVAGNDQVFYPAKGQIKNNVLIVSSTKVKQPVAVRYQFSNTGMGNIATKDGLPVAPFRTDNWGN